MIGYNVKRANELMESIAQAYKDLGIYTKEQWDGVLYILQGQWIGEDEQDFEKRLADRICTLYLNASELANNSIETIAGLAQAWHDFQQKNTITGETVVGDAQFKLDKPKIDKVDDIVKPNIKTIANDANRGLQTETSKQTIQDKITEFVNAIKAKTTGLFETIQTNSAFFGDQTTAIKSYVDKVGAAIGEVTVAVKDMFDALDNLAATSYTTATSDITQQFTQANTNVENSLNDLGNTRWSA